MIKEVALKDHTPNWRDENITVCSVNTKKINSFNYRHLQDHRTNTQAMWLSLGSMHQDFIAGGRMYWLRKLVLYRMTDEDVDKHLDEMPVIYKKLNTLVRSLNPLTADDIFATALLISLPPLRLHSVSHLLNSPHRTSSQIVACPESESTRRSSSIDDLPPMVSVSKAAALYDKRNADGRSDKNRGPRTPYNPEVYCLFCKTSGHDLSCCKTEARVLSDHKDSMVDEFRKLRGGKSQ